MNARRATTECSPASEKVGSGSHALHLPVRVLFEAAPGQLNQEICKTNYVSATRAIIPLHRHLRLGMVVQLSLPLPVSWRKYSFTDVVYITPAEITAIEPDGELYLTHFKFLSSKEAIRRRRDYEARSQTGEMPAVVDRPERRRETRYEIPVELKLEVLNDFGAVISTERTVTDNISAGGARIKTSVAVNGGDIIRLTAQGEGFKCLAVVKRVYAGDDGVRRVNVQFIDAQWKP